MDYKELFRFPSSDASWLPKVGVLCALVLVSYLCNLIGGQLPVAMVLTAPLGLLCSVLLYGYCFNSMQRVTRGEVDPCLPEWSRFLTFLTEGLRLMVTWLLYSLPMLVPMLIFVGSILASGSDFSSSAMNIGIGVGSIVLICFYSFYCLLLCAIAPGVLASMAVSSSWFSGFDFSTIFGLISEHTNDYVVTLCQMVVFCVGGSIGLLACGIGVILTLPYGCLCGFLAVSRLAKILSVKQSVAY